VILNFNKLVSKLCCNFSIPIFHSQLYVHQNKLLAQIFILYISQFEPSSTSLHNVQSIVECSSQNAVQNIEKQQLKNIAHFTKSILKTVIYDSIQNIQLKIQHLHPYAHQKIYRCIIIANCSLPHSNHSSHGNMSSQTSIRRRYGAKWTY
jgi:hypothetical protein